MAQTFKIGDLAPEGDIKHKGFAYGGNDPVDGKEIWFKFSMHRMDHFSAAAWAKSQGGVLAGGDLGEYFHSIRHRGALGEMFQEASAGRSIFWLTESYSSDEALVQQFSNGKQNYTNFKNCELPALCVKR